MGRGGNRRETVDTCSSKRDRGGEGEGEWGSG